ncbi:protein REVEILLE 1 [Coffea eugenioides]|uniref:protein REVEILLE 1 n=1 Tax=Coffea eugenioides TaxID=49369 RepID=UPI000F6151D8|nr:protein REVEILLE 1 [Coffea eugenioides]
MVAASMALQDDSGSTDSETTLPMVIGNKMPLDMEVSSVRSIQLTGQFQPGGDDYAQKVRKPYTITKQRERWTEDEHKKFLEALKLYGRAWRRIEEHVGTKTAVQIRSHAQKFFSKVVRESNNGDSGSVKPIEIPPPRPKRKPLHPYPRKLSASVKSGALALEKQSAAANICSPTEANQSPTSVLSAFGSDAPGLTDSSTPEGSLSPVSSVIGGSSGFVLSEPPNLSPPKANASPSSSQVNNCSNQDEKLPLKLELFPEDNCFVKEGSEEVSSTQCLKLFGKTVMVTDSCRPSSPTPLTCKMQPPSHSDGKLAQALPWNFVPIKYSQGDLERSWGALPFGTHATLFCLPLGGERSKPSETTPPSSLQWWTYQGGASFPFVRIHSPIPIKASCFGDQRDVQDMEIQKDGSSSDSNAECECAEAESSRNLEAQSCQFLFAKEERAQASSTPCETSFLELKAGSSKCTKGFVPYKRCLAERDARSVVNSEEREEQRIRLCL